MQGFEIKFNIYAENAEEVENARKAIVGFISQHAKQGRAVTASKIAKALSEWDKNPFVKSRIIDYFKQ